MSINARNSSFLRSEVGFNFYWDQRSEAGSIYLIKTTFAYVNKRPFDLGAMTVALTELGGSFTVNSFTETENLWTPGIEFVYRAPYGLFASIEYDGEFGSGYTSNQLQGKFGWCF